MSPSLHLVRQIQLGYDRAASHYAERDWQRLWKENEAPLVRECFQRLLPAGSILDVGAGTGLYHETLTPAGYTVTSLDLSFRMLSRLASLRRVQASADNLPFRTSHFDGLVSARMLCHLEDLHRALAEWARVLRPGGLAVCTDIAYEHECTTTLMPTAEGYIEIPTFRYPDEALIEAASRQGFHFLEGHSLSAHTLRSEPEETVLFDRTGERAVGTLWLFRRAEA